MRDACLIKISLLLIITALQVTGCANIQRVKPDTGEGTKVTIYRRSYDEIWNAAIDVTKRRLTIIESNKRTGTIKAEAKDSTFGEVVGIFITPTTEGEKRYVVEVLILLKYRPVTPSQRSEPEFIRQLKAELDM